MSIVDLAAIQGHTPTDWRELFEKLLPAQAPYLAVWDQQEDIISLLNLMGAQGPSIYFAEGSNDTLYGAQPGTEPGTVELRLHGTAKICKVSSIRAECLLDPLQPGKVDYRWAYFQIVQQPLAETGLGYITYNKQEERIAEMRPGQYASLDEYDSMKQERRLPPTARIIQRMLRGSMIVFPKQSQFNDVRAADCGVHAMMNAEEVNAFLEKVRGDRTGDYLYETFDKLRNKGR